jgi:hypothetical protein
MAFVAFGAVAGERNVTSADGSGTPVCSSTIFPRMVPCVISEAKQFMDWRQINMTRNVGRNFELSMDFLSVLDAKFLIYNV